MTPVYCDADGVLLDFSAGFHAYMARVHNLTAQVNEPADFEHREAYPSVDNTAPFILSFLKDEAAFSKIKAYPEATQAIKALHAIGAPVTIITACGTDKATRRARLDCIEREFGTYIHDIHILPLGDTKQATLKHLPDGVFIDDQMRVCEAVARHTSHTVMLHHRRYNAHIPCPSLKTEGILRMTSWTSLSVPGFTQALQCM